MMADPLDFFLDFGLTVDLSLHSTVNMQNVQSVIVLLIALSQLEASCSELLVLSFSCARS